ncbi:autotransporter outer membrane beta-barrel domain-containing protein [Plesiomonas sp. PI-19]|uniref:autotransporter outer membrane beta-barrel domain-containing protein n=1 Tax=Plesiomonas sp. PI-19 TaxID=2898798 RepID=UPI001F40FD24|nr:autotransporter outer membrane beta-barrel domain-containing protein [Plesiomonas sp. PI-19]MCE5165576.1 autotransporter outer membrane beta-barrel domain-containing protein [Plesiomonas sp. PI-19]
MNRVYKVIWSYTNRCWIAVSELGRSKTKTKTVKLAVIALGLLSTSAASLATETITEDKVYNSSETVTTTDYDVVFDNSNLVINNGDVKYKTTDPISDIELTFTNGNLVVAGNNSNLTVGTTQGIISLDGTTSKLIVKDGASINAFGLNILAGEGKVVADGGSLTISDNITVGQNQEISVTNGGKVATSGDLVLANANNIASGEGSTITAKKNVYLGAKISTAITPNEAKLVVSDNASLNAQSVIINESSFPTPKPTTLVIGGEDIATTPGYINAKEILFQNEGGKILFNHTSDNYNLTSSISKKGTLVFKGGTTTLSGDNSKFNGEIEVKEPAIAKVTSQNSLGTSAISLDGTLEINSSGDFTFTNKTTGTGMLNVDTSNNSFSFKDSAITNGFTGNLKLLNTRFDLTGTNTDALATAGLIAGNNSLITVGAGNQSIAQLAFAGGTLNFGHVLPGQIQANNHITVDKKLDLTGNGIVQVDNSGVIDNTNKNIDHNLSLLEQDDTNASIKLVSLGQNATLSGDASKLQLQDMAGQSISNGVQHTVQQDGQNVAQATYDYHLTTGENQDGLYVGYGLTQLELQGSNDTALKLDASGKSGSAATLKAKITGAGDLRISGQPDSILSLSNGNNDYTGTTYLDGGTLLMQDDHVLGNTNALRLLDNTTLDMNGHNQTVGTLTALTGATVNLNGGTLTIENGGSVEEGGLTGQGAININGGIFGTLGANKALSATVTLAQGARALLNNTLGLGVGNLVNNGMVTLHQAAGTLYNNLSGNGAIELNDNSNITLAGNNHAFSGTFDIDEQSALTASAAQQLGTAQVNNRGSLTLNAQHDWSLDNRITGTGSVTKQGAGALHITNNADWTGETHIQQGNMMLGTTDAPVTLNSSHINIAQQGMLSGFGGTTGDISNSGTLFVGAPANNARMPIMPATFTVGGALNNSGTIVLGLPGRSAGNQLIVNGDYTGNNGHLLLNSVLHDDTSTTDKLIVQGNTAGHTQVHITNAGGTGAQTLNGIEVIHVQGQSDGEFSANRIVAGAYDYTLARGQGAQSNNWYLTSGKQEVPPVPTPEPAPNHDNDLRPEGGSYTANLVAANTLFQLRLQDRNSSAAYGEEPQNTNMWIKQVGGQNRWSDSSGQLKTRSNRYSLQLGGDVARWTTGESGAVRLGAMAGYGNVSSHTRSSRTGYRAEGNIHGYSTGLYATWYANDETREGAYLDSWAQYNWFNNTVKGDELQSESYRSKGVTASLEAGITHKVKSLDNGDGTKRDWYIQPQAQVVLMDVHADTHQEHNGTRVTADEAANVQTRLGVKTWLKQTHTLKSGQTGEILPYAEVNWLHNRHDFGTRLDGVTVHQSGARDIGEVKVGVEGQVNSSMNVWGNVSVQAGNNGYSDTAAMLGVQWRF